MLAVVAKNRKAISQLCIRYNVRSLELFGSAAKDILKPSAKDIDLLVEFESLSPVQHADAFLISRRSCKRFSAYRLT